MNFLRFDSNSYIVYDIQFNSLKHIELLMKTAYNKREHWEQEIVITMQSLKMVPTRVRVTSILKRAIYSGEYKSGQELSLTAIAEQLGISRTPVREAFQTLDRRRIDHPPDEQRGHRQQNRSEIHQGHL